jgi:hypothetical protein
MSACSALVTSIASMFEGHPTTMRVPLRPAWGNHPETCQCRNKETPRQHPDTRHLAGSWFAGIGKRGEELVAAGLLRLAGFVDSDEFDKWVRVGWERQGGVTVPYGLSDPVS